MDIKRILECIDDNEVIELYDSACDACACITKDDEFVEINGEMHVIIQSVNEAIPVPCRVFDKITIWNQMDFIAKRAMPVIMEHAE